MDERFDENWRGVGAAGLERGRVPPFSLCTPGATQARNFLAVAPPDAKALSPAVGLELAANCSRRPEADAVASELGELLRLVGLKSR